MTYAGRHGRADDAHRQPDGSQRRSCIDAAQAWVDDDPDHETRVELGEVLARAKTGDAERGRRPRRPVLRDAGVRHRRAARRPRRRPQPDEPRGGHPGGSRPHGIPRGSATPEPFVVIGYDARHNSDVFARDTAAVVVGAGGRAAVLPHTAADPGAGLRDPPPRRRRRRDGHRQPQPARRTTATRSTSATARQIVPPADADIAAQIARVADRRRRPARRRRLGDPGRRRRSRPTSTPPPRSSPPTARATSTSSTPRCTAWAATPCCDASPGPASPRRSPVAEPAAAGRGRSRRWPSPTPRSPARSTPPSRSPARCGPDLVLANDPDADRCAVAVPTAAAADWRMLRGDEVGALLGAHILARGVAPDAVFANSIVSSRLLGGDGGQGRASATRRPSPASSGSPASRACATATRRRSATASTPATVRDKDGVSACLLIAELAATLKAQGRTLTDVLDDLAVEHGVHATDSFSVRVADLSLIGQRHGAAARAAARRDRGHRRRARRRPRRRQRRRCRRPTGLRYYLEDGSRVIVRPSGTEPKLKVYLEVIEPVAGPPGACCRAASAPARGWPPSATPCMV